MCKYLIFYLIQFYVSNDDLFLPSTLPPAISIEVDLILSIR